MSVFLFIWYFLHCWTTSVVWCY